MEGRGRGIIPALSAEDPRHQGRGLLPDPLLCPRPTLSTAHTGAPETPTRDSSTKTLAAPTSLTGRNTAHHRPRDPASAPTPSPQAGQGLQAGQGGRRAAPVWSHPHRTPQRGRLGDPEKPTGENPRRPGALGGPHARPRHRKDADSWDTAQKPQSPRGRGQVHGGSSPGAAAAGPAPRALPGPADSWPGG